MLENARRPQGVGIFFACEERPCAFHKIFSKKRFTMELPQYTLKPNVNCMVVPWIFKLLGLSALFYAGIYFNVKYALKTAIPPLVNMLIFAFLIVLIVTQVILYHVRFGKYKYLFFTNRIEYDAKKPVTFMFSDFQQAELKQGLFDRMFGTGELKLSKKFIIGPISNVAQIKNYLEQLVNYYQSTQQRYKAQEQQASMQQQMAQSQQGAQQGLQQQARPAPQQQPVQQPGQQGQGPSTGTGQ